MFYINLDCTSYYGYSFLCVHFGWLHIWEFVHACVNMRACVWRSEINAGCPLLTLALFLWGEITHWTWSSARFAINKSQWSTCWCALQFWGYRHSRDYAQILCGYLQPTSSPPDCASNTLIYWAISPCPFHYKFSVPRIFACTCRIILLNIFNWNSTISLLLPFLPSRYS